MDDERAGTRNGGDGALPDVTVHGTVTDKGDWCRPSPATAAPPAGPHHVLGAGALLPVMTLTDAALTHNIGVLQAFAERHRMRLAPHMKTHMVPELAARQIDAGAWGVTVASAQQAMVAWAHGIRRILVANEVLDPAGLAWLAGVAAEPDADVLFQVDSLPGVGAAVAVADDIGLPLHVVIEVGFPGGRTGVRDPDDAVRIAHMAGAGGLVVRGVTGYEGGLPDVDAARVYVGGVLDVFRRIRADGLLTGGPDVAPVLSMGGSAYFDAVADALADRPDDVLVLLRSGAYLTHDDGTYERRTPFRRVPEQGSLRPAIRIWGRVTSVPEPGLALVAVGKRDAPFDEGLPVVVGVAERYGTAVAPPIGSMTVTRMDDQHTYLALADGAELTPGDVVVFGISHPCTAFDKWRLVHLIDDDGFVLDRVRTWF